MKVKDVMTKDPGFCRPENNLAELTALMWEKACGAVPLVNNSGIVSGIITDRDICIALGTRNARASEILASDVSPPCYFACNEEDDVKTALRTMASQEVRRLPVTDGEGKLAGILSLDDVALRAGPGSVSYKEVVETLKAIRKARASVALVGRETASLALANNA